MVGDLLGGEAGGVDCRVRRLRWIEDSRSATNVVPVLRGGSEFLVASTQHLVS